MPDEGRVLLVETGGQRVAVALARPDAVDGAGQVPVLLLRFGEGCLDPRPGLLVVEGDPGNLAQQRLGSAHDLGGIRTPPVESRLGQQCKRLLSPPRRQLVEGCPQATAISGIERFDQCTGEARSRASQSARRRPSPSLRRQSQEPSLSKRVTRSSRGAFNFPSRSLSIAPSRSLRESSARPDSNEWIFNYRRISARVVAAC